MKLLLPDIIRDLAVHLARSQGHGQGGCHIVLYRRRDVGLFARCTDPDIRGAQVLKLAGSDLRDLDAGDERQNHVRWKALFEVGLDTDSVGGVDENAGVLRGDDRLDDSRHVVHVRQRLDTQDDIVIGVFTGGSLLGNTDNCT